MGLRLRIVRFLPLAVAVATSHCSVSSPAESTSTRSDRLSDARSTGDDVPTPASSTSPGSSAPDAADVVDSTAATPPPTPTGGASSEFDFANPHIRVITPPANFTQLSDGVSPHGVIRTDFTPVSPAPIKDAFSLRVRHMGNACKPGMSATGCEQAKGAVANPITWAVSQYTGFTPPAPLSAWQFGYLDAGPSVGANAFQLAGTTAGVLINSWSFEHTEPVVGGGPNVVYSIDYSAPEAPFRTPGSALTLQAFVRLPWAASWSGGVGQLSFFFYLRDRTTNSLFAYVTELWDSRGIGDGNGSEFIGNDTQVNFVSSPLVAGTKFSTVSPYSATLRNQTTWTTPDFFRVHVFARQIAAAATAIESQYPSAHLSKNAADYELLSAGILQEIFVGVDPATNMSMGASYTDFGVYEFY